MTTVRVDSLTVRIGGRTLVEDVSLLAHDGDRVAVTGRSGSGKTTLLRALAGAVVPTTGTVSVAPEHARVALVPQEPLLLGALTVAENLAVFLRTAGMSPRAGREVADRVMAEFLLTKLADKLALELSGGEQQRLALARVAALRPAVLLVDEPTARQDADTRTAVVEALLAASSDGVLIMATHDADVAARCEHILEISG